MRAILVHGMGRTPASMLILATRLRVFGIRPKLFAYSAASEKFDACAHRLQSFIEKHAEGEQFILVGHSLGTVLTRAVLPELFHKPSACFFLAPPTHACAVARRCAPHRIYQLLTGEMGQLLASPQFMNQLPVPDVPTKIYAGTGGPRGRYSPFGEAPNDGVLAVSETHLPSIPLQTIPALHTFIMNAKVVALDIGRLAKLHPSLPAWARYSSVAISKELPSTIGRQSRPPSTG